MSDAGIYRHPFTSVTVRSKASATVFAYLPIRRSPFKPTWLEIARDIAPHFMITDLKIGTDRSQLASVKGVPAQLFVPRDETSPEDRLLIDELPQESMISLSVTNISRSPRGFRALVLGYDPTTPLAEGTRSRLCGLGISLLPPGVVTTITIEPLTALEPSRLYIPAPLLHDLEIVASDVVQNPQTVKSLWTAPPSLLSIDNLTRYGAFQLRPSIVPLRHYIRFHVRNTASEPRAFTGALLG